MASSGGGAVGDELADGGDTLEQARVIQDEVAEVVNRPAIATAGRTLGRAADGLEH